MCELITNTVTVLDTNGMVVGYHQTVSNNPYIVASAGFILGAMLLAFMAGFWSVKGVWNDFSGGERE